MSNTALELYTPVAEWDRLRGVEELEEAEGSYCVGCQTDSKYVSHKISNYRNDYVITAQNA